MRTLTKREKEALLKQIVDMLAKDALRLEDYAEMMQICRDACERRIAEIDAEIPTPVGRMQ